MTNHPGPLNAEERSTTIFRIIYAFFKLVKGELIVVKEGKKISEIVQPGDYFGEIAAITGKQRSETVISRKVRY